MSFIMETDPESCSMDPWFICSGGTTVMINVRNWNTEQQPGFSDKNPNFSYWSAVHRKNKAKL